MYARNSVRKLPSQLIDGIENMVNYYFVISLTSRYTYLYLSIYDPQGKQCTNQFLLSKNANDENPFSFHRHLNIFIIQLTVICVPFCIFLLIFCKKKKDKNLSYAIRLVYREDFNLLWTWGHGYSFFLIMIRNTRS